MLRLSFIPLLLMFTMGVYDFKVPALSGGTIDLSAYKGKKLLIVNVASKCGFTPQYEGLQRLYDTYRDRGFDVLGFPCNQFLFQEPASEEKIQQFCSATYNVTFPLFSKIKVNGGGKHALYGELTTHPDES